MLNRTSALILLLAALAAALGGWLQYRGRQSHAPAGTAVVRVGDLRPDLALADPAGHAHRLAEFHARRVLLNFWASWCGPCLDEMPALARAQAKYATHDALVLGIAMDDPVHVRAFLAVHPVDYPVLLGRLDLPSTSLRFGDTAEVLPYSVLLDADGRILAIRRGPLDAARIDRWLAPAGAP